MMPPWAFKAARDQASMHLQVLALNSRAERQAGKIRARVVRAFRDQENNVYPGKMVEFDVPVIAPSPGLPEPGGPIELHGSNLAASRWLEGFFDHYEGKLHLVRSQIAPIRRPSWRPVYPPEFEGFVFPGNL